MGVGVDVALLLLLVEAAAPAAARMDWVMDCLWGGCDAAGIAAAGAGTALI